MPIDDDGGPAFAMQATEVVGRLCSGNEGMTLRDWFAGQAMAPVLAAVFAGQREETFDFVAERCYHTADAMIAEKRRREMDDA